MLRHILAAGIAILAVLVFSMGPAQADRLGGAYRGPYENNTQPKDTENPEVTAQSSGDTSAPPESSKSGGSGGDGAATSGGESGGNEGGGEDPPPNGNEGGGDESSGVGGGSGSSGNNAPPPGAGGGTSGPGASIGGGLGGSGTGRKTNVEDVLAYWPFWFEHNKEWILSGILRERGARSRLPENSSVAFFVTGGDEGRERSPVTDEQKVAIRQALVDSLTNESEWVRDAAVLALGKLGDAEAIPEMAGRLNDPQPDVQEDTLLALGLTGKKEALPYLMDTLKSSDLRLKAYASLGLGLLGIRDVVPSMLKEYNTVVRNPRAEAEEAAACLAVAIGLLGDENAVDSLASPLDPRKRASSELKVHVCQALSRIGGESARKWLLRAMGDKDQAVNAAAALALGNYPEPDAIKRLVNNGLRAGDRMTKLFTVVSLGRIGKGLHPTDRARRSLVKDLRDIAENPQKDKYQSMYASLALAIMGDRSASDFFLELLSRDQRTKYSTEVHSAIAMAVGLLEEPSAKRDLREIVRKEGYVEDYRGYAAFALGLMGDDGSKETILATMEDDYRKSDLMRSCCWALGLLGDRKDVPVLIDILKVHGADKHRMRGAAAIALGLIGDSSAVDPLLKMAVEDPDNSNRAFAIAALGCMIDKDSVPRIPQLFMNVHYRKELPIVRDVLKNL